jgi:hypothetical protein
MDSVKILCNDPVHSGTHNTCVFAVVNVYRVDIVRFMLFLCYQIGQNNLLHVINNQLLSELRLRYVNAKLKLVWHLQMQSLNSNISISNSCYMYNQSADIKSSKIIFFKFIVDLLCGKIAFNVFF